MIGIRVLGGFSIERDGTQVDLHAFGGRLALTLTKILVTRRGEVVTRDALCELLWPDGGPADPGANLNALVHRARRALAAPGLIKTSPGGYLLTETGHCVVDAERFRSAVAAGQAELERDRAGAALRTLDQALHSWAGEPLPDDASSVWAQPYREALLQDHRRAVESGAEAALTVGDLRRATAWAGDLVRDAPLHEPGHRLLARALMATGDRVGALEALDTLRARLAVELGVDPTAEAQELRTRLLRDDASAAPRRGAGRPADPSPDALPFIGRKDELSRLLAHVEEGHGVALVAGQSGAGKSRLLAELASRAGLPTVTTRAFLAERNTPWALARTLLQHAAQLDDRALTVVPPRARSALADAIPDLPIPPQDGDFALEPESRRAMALEGGLRVLAAATAGGALVLIDDLQWADASSVELLGIAAERLDGVALVFSYRPEEALPGTQIGELLVDVQSDPRVPTLTLSGLAAAELAELIADPDLVAVLVTETDGNPFAVAAAVSSLDELGLVARDMTGKWQTRSEHAREKARALSREGQRRSIAARFHRQSRSCRQLLACLALLGRECPVALLGAATKTAEPDVFEGLDILSRAALVRRGDRGWAPAHDLIGETVVEELTDPQRAGRHATLAAALRQHSTTPGERAEHLLGAGDRGAAVEAFAADAREQLTAHADAEAIRLAVSALDLDPVGPLRADLLSIRAEAAARTGHLDDARRDLRAALALAEQPARRALLLVRLAMLASGAEDLGHASELVELAVVEAGGDAAARARALAAASIIDMNLQRAPRAADRANEARHLFEDIGDSRGVADVLDGRAMAAFLDGHIDQGIEQFQEVSRLYYDLGDLLRVITPRSTHGHALVFTGRPEAGLAQADAALEIALDLGAPEGTTYARWHRSEALTACGKIEEALVDAEDALAIATQLRHRGWTATAHRARGIAWHAAGDRSRAEDAFRASLAASRDLPLFACWAHGRLALTLIEQHRTDEAEQHVTSALATGPPLGQYEARLAHAHLVVERGRADAEDVVADAIRLARAGGHHASADVLARMGH